MPSQILLHLTILLFQSLNTLQKMSHFNLNLPQLIYWLSKLIKILSYIRHQKAFYILQVVL